MSHSNSTGHCHHLFIPFCVIHQQKEKDDEICPSETWPKFLCIYIDHFLSPAKSTKSSEKSVGDSSISRIGPENAKCIDQLPSTDSCVGARGTELQLPPRTEVRNAQSVVSCHMATGCTQSETRSRWPDFPFTSSYYEKWLRFFLQSKSNYSLHFSQTYSSFIV